MKQIIIIHGAPEEDVFRDITKPSPSNSNWIPWLQKQLILKDIISVAPEMPKSYDPIYEDWVRVFEQFNIDEETILVGHSCGGGFILRYLTEHPEIKLKKIILVAPWFDLDPKEFSTNFFDFEIDKNLTESINTNIFYSTDDEICKKSIEIIEKNLPNAIYYRFEDKEHFDTGLYSKEFPELLKEILN